MTDTQPVDGPARFPNAAFDVVVLAASAGGLQALIRVLASLPGDFAAATAIVQHLDPRHRSLIADILGRRTALKVKEAEEGDHLSPGVVFTAPPNRHPLAVPVRAGALCETLSRPAVRIGGGELQGPCQRRGAQRHRR